MHITCILILNVFIAISTIKMNARGNREWLTSHKLCCNLFKKFKFRMRQSKCCWLIREKTEGDVFECSFSVSSYGAFATLLWLAQVTPPLLSLWFLIKALGLELKDLWCRRSSPSLILSASVICSVFCLCFRGSLWGWWEKPQVCPTKPSMALCSEEPQRMNSSLFLHEIRVSAGNTWLWSRVAEQEKAEMFEA